MPALQLINRCPNVAGAARSYGVIVFNLMALGKAERALSFVIKRIVNNKIP